jgi:hypothetical protein
MKKVHETHNRAEAHLVAHTLEQEGVPAELRAELPSYDPASVWIRNDADAERAMAIIDDVVKPAGGRHAAANRKDRSPGILFAIGLVCGICIGMVILDLVRDTQERRVRARTEWDVNGDGRADRWREYRPDSVTVDAVDEDADGTPDYWVYYKVNDMIGDEGDSDRDGRKDYWGTYRDNAVVERRWSFGNDSIIDKRVVYEHHRKKVEYLDNDRDGAFDHRITLDQFERPVAVEKIRSPAGRNTNLKIVTR